MHLREGTKFLKYGDKRLSGLSFGISTGFRKMHKIMHIVVRLPDGLDQYGLFWIYSRVQQKNCLWVIVPAQTGQFASRWTLPSLFQNEAKVGSLTPSCFILRSLQILVDAFLVM